MIARPNLLAEPIRLASSPFPECDFGKRTGQADASLEVPDASSAFAVQSRYPALPATGRSRFGPWGLLPRRRLRAAASGMTPAHAVLRHALPGVHGEQPKKGKGGIAAGHASPLSFRSMFRYPLRDPAEPDRTACPTLPSNWGLDSVGRRLRS
jgi:hypothetical protein